MSKTEALVLRVGKILKTTVLNDPEHPEKWVSYTYVAGLHQHDLDYVSIDLDDIGYTEGRKSHQGSDDIFTSRQVLTVRGNINPQTKTIEIPARLNVNNSWIEEREIITRAQLPEKLKKVAERFVKRENK